VGLHDLDRGAVRARLARILGRDGPAMMDRWLTDWMPSEDAYEEEQRPQDR
jgi:hypothetical protein